MVPWICLPNKDIEERYSEIWDPLSPVCTLLIYTIEQSTVLVASMPRFGFGWTRKQWTWKVVVYKVLTISGRLPSVNVKISLAFLLEDSYPGWRIEDEVGNLWIRETCSNRATRSLTKEGFRTLCPLHCLGVRAEAWGFKEDMAKEVRFVTLPMVPDDDREVSMRHTFISGTS